MAQPQSSPACWLRPPRKDRAGDPDAGEQGQTPRNFLTRLHNSQASAVTANTRARTHLGKITGSRREMLFQDEELTFWNLPLGNIFEIIGMETQPMTPRSKRVLEAVLWF